MSETIRTRVSDGVSVVYPIDFQLGYIDKDHVFVYEGDVPTNQLSYTWVNDTQISLSVPVEAGMEFHIRRIVPRHQLVNDYEDDAILHEKNLDASFAQALMISEEIEDGFTDNEFKVTGDLDMDGFQILNLPLPVDPTDPLRLQDVVVAESVLNSTFAKYKVVVGAGDDTLVLPVEFQSAIVLIDGVPQFETDGAYTYDGAAHEVYMTAPFTFSGSEKVEVWLNSLFLSEAPSTGGDAGKISNYLNATQSNFGSAYVNCCIDNPVVDLEGLTLSTEDVITVPAGAKVRKVLFNGAHMTVLSSALTYEGHFPEHVGKGHLQGGALLKQVAVTSGVDTNIIKLKDVDGLKIGDFVNSSLDVYYLPNASDRAGYIDEGDFNRITNINTGTNEITLAYNFLRTSEYTVSSGLIENSWVGINTTFNSTGVSSTSVEHQHLVFKNLEISHWAGYIANRADSDADPLDITSSMTFEGCYIHDQFLDVLRFRGKDLTFRRNAVGRIYDFAKQFCAYGMNPLGTIVFEYNYMATHNGDNFLYASGLGMDSPVNTGGVVLTGNVFDGSRPADLPESDFGNPPTTGQLYYGISVPIHDCYHFYAAGSGGDGYCRSWTSTNDTWIGFQRAIFGTTFVHGADFTHGEVTFVNANVSCEPYYVNPVGKGNDELLRENTVNLVGGSYNSRNSVFCRGATVYAKNIKLTLTEEARVSPQVNGLVVLNNVHMDGGTLNGRYKVESNYSTFRDVHLAYQGTANPSSVVLFGIDTLDASSNFILDVPEDFESTGNTIDDWADDIPVVAWFGSNASGFAPSPDVSFRIAGRSNNYVFGNDSSKQYLQEIVAAKLIAPPSATTGLFSAKLELGDTIRGMADKTLQVVNESSQATTTTNAALPSTTSDIVVADSPAFTATHIAVYSASVSSWYYYTIANIVGSVITPNEVITREFAIGDPVYLISAAEVTTGGGSGTTQLSTRVTNSVNIATSAGSELVIPFDTEVHDELNAHFGATPERLIVPIGTTRVDIAGYVQYSSTSVPAGTNCYIRINHYDVTDARIAVVAGNNAPTAYIDHRWGVSEIDIPVVAGDYFTLEVAENNVAASIAKARFTMRKVR